MKSSTSSVADLDQFSWAVGLADVLQLIPVPASRAKEVSAEVVNGGLAVCELQVSGASLALPHCSLLRVKNSTSQPAVFAADAIQRTQSYSNVGFLYLQSVNELLHFVKKIVNAVIRRTPRSIASVDQLQSRINPLRGILVGAQFGYSHCCVGRCLGRGRGGAGRASNCDVPAEVRPLYGMAHSALTRAELHISTKSLSNLPINIVLSGRSV